MPKTQDQKEKAKIYQERWLAKNPDYPKGRKRKYREEHPDKPWEYHLKRKYGLTIGEYDEMFKGQNKACAVCSAVEPRGGKWAVDHCHETGTVRAIICINCNSALGMMGENIDFILDLANYVRLHKE